MKNTNMSLLSCRALLLTATAATVALSSTLISKPAFAATATSNLAVSATVNNNCTINTGTGLSFGSYSGSDATATGTVTTTCTIGASATITLDQGANAGPGSTDAAPLRRLSDGGTNNLSYELFQDADRTTDWGNTAGTGVGIVGDGGPKDTTVYGKIPGGQNVPAGPYEDSVTATVTF